MGKKNNNTITSYDNPPEKIDGDLFYSLQLDKEQEEFANAMPNKEISKIAKDIFKINTLP